MKERTTYLKKELTNEINNERAKQNTPCMHQGRKHERTTKLNKEITSERTNELAKERTT